VSSMNVVAALVALVAGVGCSGAGRATRPATSGGEVTPTQVPRVRIAHLMRDTVHVELADSGYVLVMEHRPGTHVKVVYPPVDAEWPLLSSGASALPAALTFMAAAESVVNPSPQCVVDPHTAGAWSEQEGLRNTRFQEACGLSITRGYVAVWLFDAVRPPLGLGGVPFSNSHEPIPFLRRTAAALLGVRREAQEWTAASWRAR